MTRAAIHFAGFLLALWFVLRLLSGCAETPRIRVVATDHELLAAAELAAAEWNDTGCAIVEVSSAGGDVVLGYWDGVLPWPWPHDHAAMHYRRAAAENIWLNPGRRYGDASQTDEVTDLQSVITHELGHALGIQGHVGWRDATMWSWTEIGDTSQRTLSQADVDAICALAHK